MYNFRTPVFQIQRASLTFTREGGGDCGKIFLQTGRRHSNVIFSAFSMYFLTSIQVESMNCKNCSLSHVLNNLQCITSINNTIIIENMLHKTHLFRIPSYIIFPKAFFAFCCYFPRPWPQTDLGVYSSFRVRHTQNLCMHWNRVWHTLRVVEYAPGRVEDTLSWFPPG